MASQEHKDLATFIKGVHKELRLEMERAEDSPESVWGRHLQKAETLQAYAKAMKTLATEHWTDVNNSRILWTYKQIDKYYFNGGLQDEHLRDRKFAKRHGEIIAEENIPSIEKARVLDVGSCYNPFSVFERLDVTALDIAPASPSVLRADFLSIDLSQDEDIDSQEVRGLKTGSFHVVIFCLLLVSQRLKCIENAIKLLREDGLLCIITPDSSHMGKNVEQMKSWRRGLALLGLRKLVYEKTKHFHGVIFRKPAPLLQSLTAASVAEGQGVSLESLFYIPQDQDQEGDKEMSDKGEKYDAAIITEQDREYFKEAFQQLPSFDLS